MNDRNWHARAESAKIRRFMRTENTHVRFRTRESSDSGKKMQATESGVEFKMLAKLFTEEEASLACHMRLEAETASAIAAKAVTDPIETRNTLKRMMAKGHIDIRKGEGEFAYALRPFVVGFYEGQLSRMDPEMAGRFEEYYRQTKGGVLRPAPALHRVIPVEKAIPLEVQIHPYERVRYTGGGKIMGST